MSETSTRVCLLIAEGRGIRSFTIADANVDVEGPAAALRIAMKQSGSVADVAGFDVVDQGRRCSESNENFYLINC